MTARRFNSRADWVGVILEVAERTLEENPHSRLRRATTHNISGSHDYWGNAATALFREPQTVEEGLLALELKRVLEIAVANQFRALCDTKLDSIELLNIFGFPMDFGVFLGVLEKLAVRDPQRTAMHKVLMADLVLEKTDMSLTRFMTEHCLAPGCTGEEWCANI